MGSRWQAPLLFFLLFFCSNFCGAVDTLSIGGSLTGNQTLISKKGNFELGFFSPGNSNNYYIGIWYKKISEQTVIWVLNRDIPVSDPQCSELKVAQDGNLVLLNQNKLLIWSSNSTHARNNSNVLVLLDTGNLVLRGSNNSSATIWQSFDHPTDTLLPGGWVGLNKITREYQSLTSWRSPEDPSEGMFVNRVDPFGSGQYVLLWNGTRVYWYMGEWTGHYLTSNPEMGASVKYNFTYIDNDQLQMCSFSVKNESIISRLVMTANGQLSMFDWSVGSGQWLLHWTKPTFQCGVYSVCGAFGMCDMSSSQYCRCLPGFEPASSKDWGLKSWSGGCVRKTYLQCHGSMSSDRFVTIQNVKLPESPGSVVKVRTLEECELACLGNCSCTAYAYEGGCFVWHGDLRNVQQLSDGASLHLRVAAADLPGNQTKQKKDSTAIIIVIIIVVLVSIFCISFTFAWTFCKRRRLVRQDDGSLIMFSYAYLQRCTKNFSRKVGMGSFGSVYQAILSDSSALAVKRLEGSMQGEKQFLAELRTLGKIQHVNLVRLRGFCVTRNQRLLVYDYMPNGSLDSFLSKHCLVVLDWRTRFEIMLGIARGLAYLHEECIECIIHCDIKPENILLDVDFRPKVADFGLAKLIGRDFSRVLTTARGTIGYLAPEWILGLPITPKADVFSYGMMLLELVSGRRNKEVLEGRTGAYFPLWAAMKVAEGEVLALLDERLDGDAHVEELTRACKVACWCIQDCEDLRPTMGQVVQVLEGSLRVGIAPVPRYLQHFSTPEDSFTL